MAEKKKENAVENKKAEKESPKQDKKPVKNEKPAKPKKKEGKKIEKIEMPKASVEERMKALEIIKFPLITEKAVNMIEAENKMAFIVNKNSNKEEVRKAVEALYEVKVDGVNILKDMKSRKKAFVKINPAFKASDIATKLGVL
jgi:large subunit ribosomal protein L23